MRVLISGGGIGGLTAAIACRQFGLDVVVYEQAPELKEIGAGIQIASNASVALRQLGLEDAVRSVGVMPLSYDYRDLHTGRMLYQAPLGMEAAQRYGAPMYNIHRADLVQILADALPSGIVEFGKKVVGFSQTPREVEVELNTGERVRADVLAAADGIHSQIREALRGKEEKHSAHILMWRSLIKAERLEGLGLEERGNYWLGPGRTLVTYWVRPKNLYSILASVPATEVQRETWTESGDIQELRRSFEDIEPRAQKMMDQVESSFITGMYYRDPIDNWTSGRVTLLGDAAHPMVPFLAAGAGQSIEDAWTLARVLARTSHDVPAALIEYQERRIPRTTRLQAGARSVVKQWHESDPQRIRNRNGRWKGLARVDPLAETSWGLAWDYNVVDAVEAPPGEVLGVTGLREGKRLLRPESQRAFQMWKEAFTPEDVARGHDGFRVAYDRFLTTNFPLPPDVSATPCELGGVPAFRLTPSNIGERTVLHIHGGGYMMGSARGSLEYAYRLATTLEGPCYTVDYRLAPEHPYPAALDDAVDAYRGLLSSGIPAESIVLSGESSGGALALAVALAIRNAGDPLPGGIIAIAPFADLTLSGESLAQENGNDPAAHRDLLTFMGASYFQGHEPTDPLVSPVYADLSGVPPIFLAGTRGEVLFSDATRLAERAERAGVDVTTEFVDDSVHVFTIFPFLPETQTTMEAIRTWSQTRCRTAQDQKRDAA